MEVMWKVRKDRQKIDSLRNNLKYANICVSYAVVLRGEYKKNVVYPEKTIAFRLGQGFEHGIPYGVEKALYKFRADEESVLVIKGLKYLPKDLVQAHNIKAEDEVHFHVVMKAFENVGIR